MVIRVQLFAAAREKAGHDSIRIELSEPATVAELRRATAAQYPQLATILQHSLWAVDTNYAADSTPIRPHAEIALIPPVSGG